MVTRIAPLLLLPILFSGCMVRSLQPIYTEKDIITLPTLEGTWKADDEGKDTFAFVREDNYYRFSMTESDSTLVGVAHFAKIGKRTYLDLSFDETAFPGMDESTLDPKAKSYIQSVMCMSTPIHLFYQVEVANNVLRTREMSYAWAKTRRENGRLWIDHVAQGDSTLLTADTARVQRFLRRWENSDDAWGDWEERPLVRAEPPPAK